MMTSTPTEHSSSADDDAHWEIPTSAEGGMAEDPDSASPPDPSPLLDEVDDDGNTEGPGGFWTEGGALSGDTSNSRPVAPQQ